MARSIVPVASWWLPAPTCNWIFQSGHCLRNSALLYFLSAWKNFEGPCLQIHMQSNALHRLKTALVRNRPTFDHEVAKQMTWRKGEKSKNITLICVLSCLRLEGESTDTTACGTRKAEMVRGHNLPLVQGEVRVKRTTGQRSQVITVWTFLNHGANGDGFVSGLGGTGQYFWSGCYCLTCFSSSSFACNCLRHWWHEWQQSYPWLSLQKGSVHCSDEADYVVLKSRLAFAGWYQES